MVAIVLQSIGVSCGRSSLYGASGLSFVDVVAFRKAG